ncbi:MAG: hypothetical protein QOJ39_3823 [Candidatus Eremiobacteraeota bacterium]|nr:hypothetical protein [Candidatus Eremiobacteraeota bacterium]
MHAAAVPSTTRRLIFMSLTPPESERTEQCCNGFAFVKPAWRSAHAEADTRPLLAAANYGVLNTSTPTICAARFWTLVFVRGLKSFVCTSSDVSSPKL